MARSTTQRKKPAGQRQLRVGEEIRHTLSSVFLRGECMDPDLQGVSITVSEVRISPDLKNATAFVMPLGGKNKDTILAALAREAPMLRTLVGTQMRAKFTPRLSFKLDNSFDEAGRIHTLLRKPDVIGDLTLNKAPAVEDTAEGDE